jgi:hypothetical protein
MSTIRYPHHLSFLASLAVVGGMIPGLGPKFQRRSTGKGIKAAGKRQRPAAKDE